MLNFKLLSAMADTLKRLLLTAALGGWCFGEIEERETLSLQGKN